MDFATYVAKIIYNLKGCVQGYGSYDKLTTSGIDPKELFDNIEDDELSSTDVIIERSSDSTEESNIICLDHIQLLPIEKTRIAASSHSENTICNFNQKMDGGSIHTTPSMFSLISMPSDNIRINTVIS